MLLPWAVRVKVTELSTQSWQSCGTRAGLGLSCPSQHSQPCLGRDWGHKATFPSWKQRAELTWPWMMCEHRAVAVSCPLQPFWDKNPRGQRDVGTALHGFPKVFPNCGAERCLIPFSALLSSGRGSARGVWLPWGAAGASGPLLLAGECGEPQGCEGDEFSL